jgi:hypothetical protein
VVAQEEEPVVAQEEEPVVAQEEEPVVAQEEEPVVAQEEEPVVAQEEATVEAEPVAGPEPATGDQRAHEAIRQQLIRLREAGSPREEGERYLVRYKQRGDHQEILDEVFGPEEPVKRRRRGLLRRD